MLKSIPLDSVILDPALWIRSDGHNVGYENTLADVLRAGQDLPPIKARHVGNDGVFCTDGFYTVAAHRLAGRTTIKANVRPGTWLDAVADAAGSNQDGNRAMPRTNKDKRRAVLMVFFHFREWSDAKIGKHVGVSDSLVRSIRAEHSGNDQHLLERCSPSDDFQGEAKGGVRVGATVGESKREGLDGRFRGARHEAPRAEVRASVDALHEVMREAAREVLGRDYPAPFAPRLVLPDGLPDTEAHLSALTEAINGTAAYLRASDSSEHERALRLIADLRSLLTAWVERRKAV